VAPGVRSPKGLLGSEMPPPSSVSSRSVCRDDAECVALRSRRDSLDERTLLQGGICMDSHLCVGIDIGYRNHCVGIADSDGQILEEFDIPHTTEGFDHFFQRVEHHREKLELPVAVAMEGFNGYGRPLDRLIQQKGYRLFNVNNLKPAPWNKSIPCIPRGKLGSKRCSLERPRRIRSTPARSSNCSVSRISFLWPRTHYRK